jgi:dipeptidyl aminopeptidase/acylaminoacyl peptidase
VAVFGFSAGGYTAARLRRDYPRLHYVITGAPGCEGDIELPGVAHMDLVGQIAERNAG